VFARTVNKQATGGGGRGATVLLDSVDDAVEDEGLEELDNDDWLSMEVVELSKLELAVEEEDNVPLELLKTIISDIWQHVLRH